MGMTIDESRDQGMATSIQLQLGCKRRAGLFCRQDSLDMAVMDRDAVPVQHHPFGFYRDDPAGMNECVDVFHGLKILELVGARQHNTGCRQG